MRLFSSTGPRRAIQSIVNGGDCAGEKLFRPRIRGAPPSDQQVAFSEELKFHT
jgi:hypothetical protein